MEKCTVTIDATAAVARVKFGDAAELGVLVNGYQIGDWLEIPEGE